MKEAYPIDAYLQKARKPSFQLMKTNTEYGYTPQKNTTWSWVDSNQLSEAAIGNGFMCV